MTALNDFAGCFGSPGLLMGLAGLGFAVGSLTGLFGVGGGFLVTPLLIVVFRVDESVAVGSDLCAIIGTSAGGLSRHWRLGNVEAKTMLIMAGGAMCGTVLGSMLHEYLRSMLGQSGVFSFPSAMRGLYLILLPVAG